MTNSTHHVPKSNCCTSHTLWTWLLAILLAINLYWHCQHDHGPAQACCAATSSNAPAVENTFNFTASNAHGYNATGDAKNVAWAAKSDELSTWFKGGADWVIAGNATKVTLTGNVDSQDIKKTKGTEAQAFFGTNVIIDNQLTVKMPEAAHISTETPTAKLYFDTGSTTLPADASQTLAATIQWLKANSNEKAVISGYSDPRGDLGKNKELSKDRAKAVREMLKDAGIDEDRIEMRKPEIVESGGDLAQARRVEVSIE
jgi:outer membrane protein OmpA-like peptidoglycan-associated protein